MGKKYIPLKIMAEQYSLDVRRLRNMCLRKEVKASKIGGDWFIAPEIMERYFEKHTNCMSLTR